MEIKNEEAQHWKKSNREKEGHLDISETKRGWGKRR
jgi:hypothetical protein